MKDFEFVYTKDELISSAREFYSKPEFWKNVNGNAPRYFVHIQNDKKHIFGLSKFCAFKDISVESYINFYRYETDGGKTQKHIAKILKQDWIPRDSTSSEIRNEFDKWISSFHPNYNLQNASFITVKTRKNKITKKKRGITPKELEKRLKLQRKIGEIGEEIALNFEIQRLESKGISNVKKYIEHTSKLNSAAGFDISSTSKNDERFIEVKSSLNKKIDFYITENEYNTLKYLKEKAYIYYVHITNLETKKGKLLKEIKNPIQELEDNFKLKPIAYKATLK